MTREEFIATACSGYEEISALNTLHSDDFYNYEKDFVELWQNLGRTILEKNISTTSKS